jgi:hypothetical protein
VPATAGTALPVLVPVLVLYGPLPVTGTTSVKTLVLLGSYNVKVMVPLALTLLASVAEAVNGVPVPTSTVAPALAVIVGLALLTSCPPLSVALLLAKLPVATKQA